MIHRDWIRAMSYRGIILETVQKQKGIRRREPIRYTLGPGYSGRRAGQAPAPPGRARAQSAVAGVLDDPQCQPPEAQPRRPQGRGPPSFLGVAGHAHDRALLRCAAAGRPGRGQAPCQPGVPRHSVPAGPAEPGPAGEVSRRSAAPRATPRAPRTGTTSIFRPARLASALRSPPSPAWRRTMSGSRTGGRAMVQRAPCPRAE